MLSKVKMFTNAYTWMLVIFILEKCNINKDPQACS